MQQIKIICVGKLKNKNLKEEISELSKRISRFEVLELKDIKDKNPEIVKRKEYETLSNYINSSYFNILLSEKGRRFDTKGFYGFLRKIEKPIQFIISGAYGPDERLYSDCDLSLSLSDMTFTHEQALYMLVEQVYRVECFEKGINYTK